mmetsp:Transcript_2105/g.2386  ORF Transcript_2105/g.2386 Transcript_2105/m.2386 type:complete len:532 (+) Transcript_2105:27-1622(+)|eukprot:CAMPEP_0205825900 /NCGR_PEP_ID=MMETSP0206-20130828/26808_1 /ASSEMBLY_ACC=CAM_ASM_000279 /TAXON_ID=36767 /ORGANISM="Euplotes focardii, Strain TN1" /LENGTH=531 /DNA_ID=CAMNT_0053125325 /DNA_START=22 /DNA_END=1617 /DNA_ORIENTATION=+
MAEAKEAPWEKVQKKTFTKWCNNHLNKAWGSECQIVDILNDWESGILLMRLAVALYKENDTNPEQAISFPKLRANELNPKNRIQMVNNGTRALGLLEKAGVKLRASAENLCDHDKVAILGMVWMIILDYASRGFGGTSAEVKKALLEWVNQKTEGYERVNPPGVKNFHKDWRSGLAWCALIHRHRPELIDYEQCLTQSNMENLEQAFSVAEESLDIPRLLDPEDVDVEKPDDKSVLTYVMEYFNAFAGEAHKEAAAKQAAEWLRFLREIQERKNQYEARAKALLAWIKEIEDGWAATDFGSTKAEADGAFDALRAFVGSDKPPQECEKMDLEALFAEIQTILSVNGLAPFAPASGLEPTALEAAFEQFNGNQSKHGRAVRENRFKFIEKKEDNSEEEVAAQIRKTFDSYDDNGNGNLSKEEFNAACMEMGIVAKTQEEKDAFFDKIAGGSETCSFESFSSWMTSRLVVKMDDAISVKSCFETICNGSQGMSEGAMNTHPFTDEDREFLQSMMPQNEDGTYDYSAFVDGVMA